MTTIQHWQNKLTDLIIEEIDGIRYSERWSAVRAYEGLYEISNFGRVRSLDKKRWSPRNNSFSFYKGKILSISNRGNGYLCVSLTKNKIESVKLVHILVAKVFITNPKKLPEVNHLFGNKSDNRWLMLEWSTRRDNALHSVNVLNKNVGNNHGGRKLNSKEANEIFILYHSRSDDVLIKDIATKYGVTCANVCAIGKGQTWSRAISNNPNMP